MSGPRSGPRRRDRDLAVIALLLSLLIHAALAVAVLVLGDTASQRREAPRSIDLVGVQAPAPAAKEAEPAKSAAPPLLAPPAPDVPSPSPEPAAEPAPSLAPSLAPSQAPAETAGPAGAPSAGPPGPAAATGAPAQAPAEPDYLPQFKITEVPIVPAKAVLSSIEYPRLAARQGIEATVFLELFIDDAGKVRKITVLKDPGHGFAEAAVAALSGITCVPAKVDGQAVAVRFRYPVRFTLK